MQIFGGQHERLRNAGMCTSLVYGGWNVHIFCLCWVVWRSCLSWVHMINRFSINVLPSFIYDHLYKLFFSIVLASECNGSVFKSSLVQACVLRISYKSTSSKPLLKFDRWTIFSKLKNEYTLIFLFHLCWDIFPVWETLDCCLLLHA